jgi:hypothetical protein
MPGAEGIRSAWNNISRKGEGQVGAKLLAMFLTTNTFALSSYDAGGGIFAARFGLLQNRHTWIQFDVDASADTRFGLGFD